MQKKNWRIFAALYLAAQLPDKKADALTILDHVRDIVNKWRNREAVQIAAQVLGEHDNDAGSSRGQVPDDKLAALAVLKEAGDIVEQVLSPAHQAQLPVFPADSVVRSISSASSRRRKALTESVSRLSDRM